ncbi:MAG: alpha/beta hydrolase [Rhodococcus sp. (in: high G+C Gram-positive bacteria)]
MLHDEGGSGTPVVLLHGLMGGPRTWRRQVPWLREHGHVYTVRAAGHGRAAPTDLSTETFVDDLAAALDQFDEMVLIGHSMGALHAWCYAAREPDRVRGLVVEDMAPDFRGRTSDGWAELIRAWPQPFPDDVAVLDFFGDVAGQYFLDSFVRGDDGLRLHGSVDTFQAISDEWGGRHFWDQWKSVRAPALLLEAEHTVTPAGQMSKMAQLHPESRYAVVPGAGHLVHDDRPVEYRREVDEFLRTLAGKGEGAGGVLFDQTVREQ